ncbi:hypothetical protein JTM52_33500, partial [Pseudomonas aeruginosa]|nr:hypothetical protein [Pseudomonas aeruginosa]
KLSPRRKTLPRERRAAFIFASISGRLPKDNLFVWTRKQEQRDADEKMVCLAGAYFSAIAGLVSG